MKQIFAAFAFSFASMMTVQTFAASPTAQVMTCAQAQAQYLKAGRINVIAHGTNVIPIYGMQAYLSPKPFNCNASRSNRRIQFYFVKTTDIAKCAIAKYCN